MLPSKLKPILLCCIFLPAVTRAENIQLIIQEFAPYGYTNPKTKVIEGYLTEKAQEIIKRSGATSSISSTSLARGLLATKTDANTCLLNLRRTPDRENLFTWVGPLTTTDWVLYGRNNDKHHIKTLEDAKPYRIGSYKSSATGLELAELGYKIEFAASDDENPNLLMIKRIDYWIVAEPRGMVIAQDQGYGGDISKLVKYKSVDLYMLCNKELPKNKLDQLNRINKEIDNDGTMQKLLRKYGIR
jgi:polar amino acid transport system substrate-binding protein